MSEIRFTVKGVGMNGRVAWSQITLHGEAELPLANTTRSSIDESCKPETQVGAEPLTDVHGTSSRGSRPKSWTRPPSAVPRGLRMSPELGTPVVASETRPRLAAVPPTTWLVVPAMSATMSPRRELSVCSLTLVGVCDTVMTGGAWAQGSYPRTRAHIGPSEETGSYPLSPSAVWVSSCESYPHELPLVS